MIDATFGDQPLSQSELPLQNENGSPTEFDTPVLMGLGAVLVEPVYASLADTQHPVCSVVVGHDQRNFFRRPKACKESEFIVVALGLTPIRMQGGDQDFDILDAERIDAGSILFANARAA